MFKIVQLLISNNILFCSSSKTYLIIVQNTKQMQYFAILCPMDFAQEIFPCLTAPLFLQTRRPFVVDSRTDGRCFCQRRISGQARPELFRSGQGFWPTQILTILLQFLIPYFQKFNTFYQFFPEFLLIFYETSPKRTKFMVLNLCQIPENRFFIMLRKKSGFQAGPSPNAPEPNCCQPESIPMLSQFQKMGILHLRQPPSNLEPLGKRSTLIFRGKIALNKNRFFGIFEKYFLIRLFLSEKGEQEQFKGL